MTRKLLGLQASDHIHSSVPKLLGSQWQEQFLRPAKKLTALRFLIENGYSSRVGSLRFLM